MLALTAIGLLSLATVTYTAQRSFLRTRIDQQALAALPALSHILDMRGINVPGAREANGGSGGPGGRHDGGPGAGGGPRDSVDLPPGTYGERRDGTGKGLGHVVLSYGQRVPAAPSIPSNPRIGRPFTVEAVGSSSTHYRVLATATTDQPGTTIIAVPLHDVDETLDRLVFVEGLVIGGVLLALGVAGWLLVRLGLRPLDRMGETAGAIAAGDLARRVSPAEPRTEVGRLGLALNAMLGRLEEAFTARARSEDRLRRFLADASHELRTPLSSIRGYAELMRTGAASTPEDRHKATKRIEQEAARMGVLVEDLLTLARLDEIRDPVRESIDVAELARDAVADARATAPDRRIELRSTDEPMTVLGDPHQLQQVLANLMRNALVHTPRGTPVELTAAREEAGIRIEVRDHGPGLPASNGTDLFERFWRADPARTRGRAGAGLGLAIVAGVVAAHGGRVEARNAQGGGALFVVRMPAHDRVGRSAETLETVNRPDKLT